MMVVCPFPAAAMGGREWADPATMNDALEFTGKTGLESDGHE